MGREQKKGRTGSARAYITRAKALKKLQLSLPEFRRLCILKGIYPRDPKKKIEGADKTYYLRKDIDFLAHERIIDTIRSENAHRKKVVKATAKKQLHVLKSLVAKTPKANLDHIIVERFPQFGDALRELDDPLCVVALFASLPAERKLGIKASRVTNCKRLINEFHRYIALTHALRRVFVSIKGFYFQAEVQGELLTWITPHRFPQNLPDDVDYSVMLTFLELYECLLNFVNFRLYTSHNLAYPPKVDYRADADGLEFKAVIAQPGSRDSKGRSNALAESKSNSKSTLSADVISAVQQALAESKYVDGDDSDEEGDGEVKMPLLPGIAGHPEKEPGVVSSENDDVGETETDKSKLLFAGTVFVLGRETPVVELEFVLKSAGVAKVIYDHDVERDGELLKSEVTHWVADRPTIVGPRIMSVEYVQPQFVFDSVNAGVLLPPQLYAPGASLPPHLSPFVVDEDDGGYRPWFKDVIERIKAGDKSVLADSAVAEYLRSSKKSADDSGVEDNIAGAAKSLPGLRAEMISLASENSSQELEDRVATKDARVEDEEELSSEEDLEIGTDSEGGRGNASKDDDDEAKDLRLLMMSRSKRKKYSKFAREETAKTDRKAKLIAQRDRLSGKQSHPDSARPRKKPKM